MLLTDHTGTLWIGTAGGGLIGYHDGAFTAHTARDGLSEDYIACLCEDRAGAVWAGTLTHGLNRWRDGRWSPAVPALADSDISALAADPSGDVWAGTPNGLFRVRGDTATAYPPPEGTSDRRVRSLCCDHTGKLWVGTTLGLQRLDEGRLVTVDLGEGGRINFVHAICEARDGTLWIGHGGEVLCRGADGRFAPCRTQGELAINAVWPLYEDPEGNVWIGTDHHRSLPPAARSVRRVHDPRRTEHELLARRVPGRRRHDVGGDQRWVGPVAGRPLRPGRRVGRPDRSPPSPSPPRARSGRPPATRTAGSAGSRATG